MTEIGGFYSKLTGETTEAVVNRFFGIFFAMFQSSQIFGNIISSNVLKSDTNTTNQVFNYSTCGAYDCPVDEEGEISSGVIPSTVRLYICL